MIDLETYSQKNGTRIVYFKDNKSHLKKCNYQFHTKGVNTFASGKNSVYDIVEYDDSTNVIAVVNNKGYANLGKLPIVFPYNKDTNNDFVKLMYNIHVPEKDKIENVMFVHDLIGIKYGKVLLDNSGCYFIDNSGEFTIGLTGKDNNLMYLSDKIPCIFKADNTTVDCLTRIYSGYDVDLSGIGEYQLQKNSIKKILDDDKYQDNIVLDFSFLESHLSDSCICNSMHYKKNPDKEMFIVMADDGFEIVNFKELEEFDYDDLNIYTDDSGVYTHTGSLQKVFLLTSYNYDKLSRIYDLPKKTNDDFVDIKCVHELRKMVDKNKMPFLVLDGNDNVVIKIVISVDPVDLKFHTRDGKMYDKAIPIYENMIWLDSVWF